MSSHGLTTEIILGHLCCITEDEFREWVNDQTNEAWERGLDTGYDMGRDRW